VGVQIPENARNRAFNQTVDVNLVNIFFVDDIEKFMELLDAGRKLVGASENPS
jgi:hypothetical protein